MTHFLWKNILKYKIIKKLLILLSRCRKKVNCWRSTQKVSWYRRKLSVKKSKNFMQELIFLIRRNFTSIFLYISLGISRPRIWKWGGVVMTTFYYNSVNHQSGLQKNTFSKLSYFFNRLRRFFLYFRSIN